MKIYLLTNESTSLHSASQAQRVINKKNYKSLEVPLVSNNTYSMAGIRQRNQVIEMIGYRKNEDIEKTDKKDLEDISQYLAADSHKKEYFQLWFPSCTTKGERVYIGTVQWLMENLKWVKKGRYPPKLKKALGLHPYKRITPIAFEKHLGIMRHLIGKELKKNVYLIEKKYDPRHQDRRCFHYQARKNIVKNVGPLIHYMGKDASQWIHCWFEGLQIARRKDPHSKKLFMNHKFMGAFFPIGYLDNQSMHPRLLYKNYNSISNIKGSWRKHSARLWEECTGLHLYSVDLTSAHARFFYWAISQRLPVNNNALVTDSFWDNLANQFLNITQLRHKLPYKPIRKLFKIGSLALMNGGALNSRKNLMPAIKKKNDLENNPIKWSLPLISTYFSNLKSSIEIKKASKILENGGIIWPSGASQRYVKNSHPHRVLSAIYCGPELLALTHLVQISLMEGVGLLPMALEMDGLLVASKENLSDEQLENLSNIYELVLTTIFGIALPVKIQSVV